MSKRAISNTTADPTLAVTPVVIGDKEYKLCFDYGALAEAEAHYNAQGHNVNLLFSLPKFSLESVRINFACSVRKFHPELSFEDACKLVTIKSMTAIANAVATAWYAEMPEAFEDQPKNELAG